MTDVIAHRRGRTIKSDSACRTPVAVLGGVCASHRPAPPVHATTRTAPDLAAAFVKAYRCHGCDATVDLFTAGPAQLIVVGHATACSQLTERVSRRYAA